MEKFGIFNLLSALSSLSSLQQETETDAKQEQPAPPQRDESAQNARPAGVFSAEERKTRAAEMLERHEKIAGRIRNR